jgi:membrane protease YdiL (CAAX protease family)
MWSDKFVAPVFQRRRTGRIADCNTAAVIVGLTVAWGGTALLISPVARSLGDPSRVAHALIGQALLWTIAAGVVASVLLWERRSIHSIWLQEFRWQSITWGLILVAVYYTVLFPLGDWARRTAGLPGFGAGMEEVTRFPIWYRMIAVVGAGIGEEVIFRGFSVTRIAMLTGSIRLAALIALIGFYALHVPVWGWGFALGGLVSGAGVMAFFIWRKDLLAMMVFHLSTDAFGLVVAPLLSEWWKNPSLF